MQVLRRYDRLTALVTLSCEAQTENFSNLLSGEAGLTKLIEDA